MNDELIKSIKEFHNKQNKLLDEMTNYSKSQLISIIEREMNENHYSRNEIDRLNNIINRIDNFVDRTIEVIKQQPTGDDEWILERLNGIKYLIELKENNK